MNRASASTARPGVSGLVISFNREDLISTCLKSLGFVDELIVFDKSSTDRTAEIARQLSDRVTIVPWSPVVEDTRAAAIAACTHDWIVCLDDDECLSVEAARFVERELANPRSSVYLLPLRHYILGQHDERAYYWPERHPRFFHRNAITFRNVVHGNIQFDRREAFEVPLDQGVCIHHLSHSDVRQWIEKSNRYTSQPNRVRPVSSGQDLRRFAHEKIDEYTRRAAGLEHGSYPEAVGVLRALYDIIDRLKSWEDARGWTGTEAFTRICVELEQGYDAAFPKRHRAGALVDPSPGPARVPAGAAVAPAHVVELENLRHAVRTLHCALDAVGSGVQEALKPLMHSVAEAQRDAQRLQARLDASDSSTPGT